MAKKKSEENEESATVELQQAPEETILEELIWHTETRKIN